MSRRAYLYFALTFVLGVIVGGVGILLFGWYSGRWHHRPPRTEQIVEYLHRELNLDPAQTQQVRKIVEETGKKFAAIHKQMDTQFDAVRDESREETRKILGPDQLAKFNALVQKWDARMKHHRPH
jgi:Spy/CpxP family protein refolding chaperone